MFHLKLPLMLGQTPSTLSCAINPSDLIQHQPIADLRQLILQLGLIQLLI